MARARPFGNIRKLPSGRFQAWTGTSASRSLPIHLHQQDRRETVAGHRRVRPGARPLDRSRRGQDPVRGVRDAVGRPSVPYVRGRGEIDQGQLRHIVVVFAKVSLRYVHPVDVRTRHGRLAASGLHHNTVAKIYRPFRIHHHDRRRRRPHRAWNPVRIKGASAERMIERPLLRWDDIRSARRRDPPQVRVPGVDGSGERPAVRRAHRPQRSNTSTSNAANCEVMQALQRHQGPRPDPRPTEDRTERSANRAGRRVDRRAAGGSHRELRRRGRAGRARLHVTPRSTAAEHLLRPAVVEGPKEAVGLAPCPLPRPPPPRRHRGCDRGASLREVMSIMGHASSAASLRYLKTRRESRSREDRRRDRPAHGELTHCSDWRRGEFESPIELHLVPTTYEFPVRFLKPPDPPRLVVALHSARCSTSQTMPAGSCERILPSACSYFWLSIHRLSTRSSQRSSRSTSARRKARMVASQSVWPATGSGATTGADGVPAEAPGESTGTGPSPRRPSVSRESCSARREAALLSTPRSVGRSHPFRVRRPFPRSSGPPLLRPSLIQRSSRSETSETLEFPISGNPPECASRVPGNPPDREF